MSYFSLKQTKKVKLFLKKSVVFVAVINAKVQKTSFKPNMHTLL